MPTPDYVERNNQAAVQNYMRQQVPSYGVANPVDPYYATSAGWYGPPVPQGQRMLPAVQASGAHFSAPGSREGWIEQGIPPVVYQRNPYATAAFRVTPNPWGGASVAPLVGFPSRYPHVLSGVPMQQGSLAMSVMAPYIMRPQPAPARPAAPAKKTAAKTNTTQQNNQQPATQAEKPGTPAPTPRIPTPPADYTGINTVEGGSMPRTVVGEGTAPQLRNDPDLTQANPNAPVGVSNRAASSIDALNDMANYYFATGQRPQLRDVVRQPVHPSYLDADTTGVGATRMAQNMGLNRGVYWEDLQNRMRLADNYRYEEALRQQRGY